jgi:hypothetical protein
MVTKTIPFCLLVVGMMNSGMTEVISLSSIGNPAGYGTLYQGGFRSVSEYGVNGVFLPNQSGVQISTTGLTYSFSSSLVSESPSGETIRSQWQNNPSATMEDETASLNNYFTPRGINWAQNALFAGSNAGITYDLFAIGSSVGKTFSKFTTYFGNHVGLDTIGGGLDPANLSKTGDASYAIIVDGQLASSGTGYTARNPFSGLIEVDLTESNRFLTLVIGDNGDDQQWDHGVYVAPSLTTVPEPSSLSLLALGGLALAINKRRRA